MARVFLSYAREDADCAKQLAELLARTGHEVWWDQHIQGGSRFSSEIDRALKDCEAVIVLWSPASVESAWVQDEAAEGRDEPDHGELRRRARQRHGHRCGAGADRQRRKGAKRGPHPSRR